MGQIVTAILTLLLGLGVGAAAILFVTKGKSHDAQTTLLDAQRKLAEADADIAKRQQVIEREGREEVQREIARLRETIERETAERRQEIKDADARLRERERETERRLKSLEGRERNFTNRENEVQRKLDEAAQLVEQQKETLASVASMTQAEARDILLERVAEECRQTMSQVAKRIEDEARENAEEKARKILALAIQRCAVDQTAETAVSVVPLPSEDLKGRIIGREGRNIRTFEQLSGTDLIIDDTPEAVVISCFDPVRREVARIALSHLVNDGRIHPARIEEMLNRAEGEANAKMRDAAERACAEAKVRLPRPIMDVFGRLLYRYSYGQNILKHSVEMAKLAASIAAELGADVQVAKRAALLHDIGKALDHDHEGTHVDLGMELLRRHRESDAVIRAAGEHHMDVTQMTSLESVIVQVADAISSARPGARRENVELYLKRLENLERIAESFTGVEKSYAIQAGREVRIVVKPDQVDDLASLRLARDVAQRIQEEMTYPGEIKVTVIRETRAVDYAK